MKKLLKIPYYLLVAAVMALGLLLVVTLVPVPGNLKAKIVKSGSMEPSIMTGSIVFIKPASSYGVGDVITFGKDTKTQIPTTHRIVSEESVGSSKLFTTKGDANDSVDPSPVKLHDVSGKVVLDIPYVGFILDFAKKPLGFVLLVGIPALIVIVDEMLKIIREVRRMRRKNSHSERWSDRDMQEYHNEYRNQHHEDHRSYRSGNVLDLRARMRGMHPASVEKQSPQFSARFFMLILLAALPIVGVSRVGGTISYYNEEESSLANVMQASAAFHPAIPTTPTNTFVEEDTLPIVGEILAAASTEALPEGDEGVRVSEEPTQEEKEEVSEVVQEVDLQIVESTVEVMPEAEVHKL